MKHTNLIPNPDSFPLLCPLPGMPFPQNFPRLSLLLFSSNATLLERLPAGLYTAVVFSRSVMSHSLWPHGLQHACPPCPSPSPEFAQTPVHGAGQVIQPSHPLLPPFSSFPQPFPASGSFPMSWLFTYTYVYSPIHTTYCSIPELISPTSPSISFHILIFYGIYCYLK